MHTVKWFQILPCKSTKLTSVNSLCILNRYTWYVRDYLSVISFLNKLELVCLNSNFAIVSTQLNGFNYCYVRLITLFNIINLLALSEVVPSIGMYH